MDYRTAGRAERFCRIPPILEYVNQFVAAFFKLSTASLARTKRREWPIGSANDSWAEQAQQLNCL
jgi:hypothetical protein